MRLLESFSVFVSVSVCVCVCGCNICYKCCACGIRMVWLAKCGVKHIGYYHTDEMEFNLI